jgi:hypothetical protein
MRTLKFRAWSTTAKRMIYDIQQEPADSTQYSFADYLEDKNMVVMQFTGLHDKNGKDGHDGDIVKMFDRSLFVLKWYEDAARFQLELVKGDERPKVHSMDMLVWSEIIGNIHENPELVEVKQ